MQKRIFAFCLAISTIIAIPQSHAQRGRSEIAFGYGYWSIFSLVNGTPYNASSGNYNLTYRNYLNKDVTLGMGIGTENINNDGSYTTIAPEVTVNYLDTRHSEIRVRLYGSFAYGVTVYNDNNIKPGHSDGSGIKAWGFNAVPFGIRIGRQVAFFTEVGLGYKGLIHAGVDFRFPRVLARNRHRDE